MTPTAARFLDAYTKMATVARYRPESPSDGFGTVFLSDKELRDGTLLQDEADRFATRLYAQDRKGFHTLYGCVDSTHARLFVYLLSAAGLCFAGTGVNRLLRRLLRMAIDELDEMPRD